MSKLKEGVNLRAYERKSPLNLYIEDGNRFFETMKREIINNGLNTLFGTPLPVEEKRLRAILTSEEVY